MSKIEDLHLVGNTESRKKEFNERLIEVRRIAEASKEVVNFAEGYIVISPEMKRFWYAEGEKKADPDLYERAFAFEKLCAQLCISRMFDKTLFPDARDPVDLVFSIGTSGISFGNTFFSEYEAWMKDHYPNVDVTYLPIQKLSEKDKVLLKESEGMFPDIPTQSMPIHSFTKHADMQFGIPVLTKAMVDHTQEKVNKNTQDMFVTDGKRRYLLIDDVFAHGKASQGIRDALNELNPGLTSDVAVAIMSKLFQHGEDRIRENSGMATFAPIRYGIRDEVNKTYHLCDLSAAYSIAA